MKKNQFDVFATVSPSRREIHDESHAQTTEYLSFAAGRILRNDISGSIRPVLVARFKEVDVVPTSMAFLYDQPYAAPACAHACLERRYGKGWRVPVRNHNYKLDDRNISRENTL